MPTFTDIKYNDGTTESRGFGVDWTNPSNAWDDNDSNRASCSITFLSPSTYKLVGQTHDNTENTLDIKKVEIGVKGYATGTVSDLTLKLYPRFDGTTSSDFLSINGSNFNESTINYVDITGFDSSPGDGNWVWADITTLDVVFTGDIVWDPAVVYVNQLYARVTSIIHYVNITETITITDNIIDGGGGDAPPINETISIIDHVKVSGGFIDNLISESMSIIDHVKVSGGFIDNLISEILSINDLSIGGEFGAIIFDTSGNETLKITDTLTRLIYTGTATAGHSGSTQIPVCNNPVAFSVPLEAYKLSHKVSVTGTTLTWTARGLRHNNLSLLTGDSLLYVVSYD